MIIYDRIIRVFLDWVSICIGKENEIRINAVNLYCFDNII